MEPDELRHEGHVGVGNLSFVSDQLEAIFKCHFLGVNHVAQTHRR